MHYVAVVLPLLFVVKGAFFGLLFDRLTATLVGLLFFFVPSNDWLGDLFAVSKPGTLFTIHLCLSTSSAVILVSWFRSSILEIKSLASAEISSQYGFWNTSSLLLISSNVFASSSLLVEEKELNSVLRREVDYRVNIFMLTHFNQFDQSDLILKIYFDLITK